LISPQAIGDFINEARDPLGNTALHVASIRGSLDCLDLLLDQEGVEVDPKNRMEGDTPLHSAARLSTEAGGEEDAREVIEMLLEAGADPRFVLGDPSDGRVRNKGELKPVDIVPPQLVDLRNILKRAELKYILSYDVVQEGLFLSDLC
jgi:uncharacterized protein